MKIPNKEINKKDKCFIIAEAGVNHNGRMDLAKKLIDIAADAGADAVKFQTFTSKNVVTDDTSMAAYQEKNIGKKESQLDMIRKLELSFDQFTELKDYCDKKEILFLSTPHSPDVVDFLDKLMPIFKIGSSDLTNIPLLKNIAKKNKKIILSTGMATIDDIKDAIQAIESENNKDIVLLHCTTSYPCALEDVNLRAMETMMKIFDYPVGYSDHTLGLDVSKLAVKKGAKLIERHFTIDKDLEGPDHKASLDPSELKELIDAINNNNLDITSDEELIMGNANKIPIPAEIEIAKVARKSIIVNKNIAKGELITEDTLIIKRPGSGISSKKLPLIIGKRTTKDLKRDTLLQEGDFT